MLQHLFAPWGIWKTQVSRLWLKRPGHGLCWINKHITAIKTVYSQPTCQFKTSTWNHTLIKKHSIDWESIFCIDVCNVDVPPWAVWGLSWMEASDGSPRFWRFDRGYWPCPHYTLSPWYCIEYYRHRYCFDSQEPFVSDKVDCGQRVILCCRFVAVTTRTLIRPSDQRMRNNTLWRYAC